MTLVMAYSDPVTREITMMADTHSFDDAGAYPNVKKIVRREMLTPSGTSAGELLIGFAGDASIGITARNAKMPTITLGTEPEVVVDKVAKSLQKYGAKITGGINYHGGTDQLWLVGWNGHIWEFVHYDILDVRPFGAIGVGSTFAYGAWDGITQQEDVHSDPFDDVTYKLAVIAGIVEKRHHKVRSPFQVERISGMER